MLSRETLERYRRMTPGERLRLTRQMIISSVHDLMHGPVDVVNRRFQLLKMQNDERNRNILTTIGNSQND